MKPSENQEGIAQENFLPEFIDAGFQEPFGLIHPEAG
jgi:hypothetical protein